MQKNCSVIILAAGYSRRMGSAKFNLRFSDGISFLDHILKQYTNFGCQQIIVVVNKEVKTTLDQNTAQIRDKVEFIINEHPEFERFFSVKTGLSIVKNNHPVFIHNVDNPFADLEVLNKLYSKKLGADIIKPVFNNKGGHPILISNKIVKGINSEKDYTINLGEFLKNYSTMKIQIEDEKILYNVNTKDDYEKLFN